MSNYGLQVWDESGKEIFNSMLGCARYLGSFIPTTASGQMTISDPNDGQPIQNLMVFTSTSAATFQYSLVNSTTIRFTSVWAVGNTIYWRDFTPNVEQARIYYGDSYE